MISREEDEALRAAAFSFLDALAVRSGRRAVKYDDVAGFEFRGTRIPLMPTQQGIRKPAGMETALSFVTKFAADEANRPYADAVGADDYLRYKWRGSDPAHPENAGMARAMERGLPLIWFKGVARALYMPVYPVWVLWPEPDFTQFAVSLDEARPEMPGAYELGETGSLRRYREGIAKTRLHQREFRERILTAYQCRCALCRLRHAELLDAAHIKEDSAGGEPVISNGIAMCKIHHAAYDNDIMGIDPEYRIRVREDVLEEIDGPTLKYTLQGLNGEGLWTPRSKRDKPDRDLLSERFERFLATRP